MTATKRRAKRPLPPMPLSELPMMKALLAITAPPAGGKATRHSRPQGIRPRSLTILRLTIIDKLQVLALRRPRALVIVAQIVDRLLDQLLNTEHVDRRTTKTTVAAVRTRVDRHTSNGAKARRRPSSVHRA